LYLQFGQLCGYAWVFPRKTSVNIGLGGSIIQGRQLRTHFINLINFLKQYERIPSTIEPNQPVAALLPMTYPTKNCIGKRTMLIGDAGGFCSSATGEGIYYAMKSGKLAAVICQQLLHQKTYSNKSLQSFYQRWQQELGNELKFQYMAKNYVLMNERRCRAAVNWASQDHSLKEIFTDFLTGRQDYAHLKPKMMFHYLRCKGLDKLHVFKKPQLDKDYEASLKEWNPPPF
jgi:flavin-dependent dehydrogenase